MDSFHISHISFHISVHWPYSGAGQLVVAHCLHLCLKTMFVCVILNLLLSKAWQPSQNHEKRLLMLP